VCPPYCERYPWHNISIVVTQLPPGGPIVGAIRVDTNERDDRRCSLDVCDLYRHEEHDRDHIHHHHRHLVVVRTPVPRCQAEEVCRSLGMHLANIDINNFLESTTLAYRCSGPDSQSWIDDWNGDEYQGTCIALATGNTAPGGAIVRPSCCSARLPVICQRERHFHPQAFYSCNDCQKSCFCRKELKTLGSPTKESDCNMCKSGQCEACTTCNRPKAE